MSIDETVPTGTDLVSSLDSYIRADRAQINLLWNAISAANATYTAHEMGAGEFALEIGTDLESAEEGAIRQLDEGGEGGAFLVRWGLGGVEDEAAVQHSHGDAMV